MRTVIEEGIVSETIDQAAENFPRLDDAFEALKWWLARKPESGEALDDLNWIYKQAGDVDIGLPALTVIYTFDAKCVKFEFLLVRMPVA